MLFISRKITLIFIFEKSLKLARKLFILFILIIFLVYILINFDFAQMFIGFFYHMAIGF